MSEGVLSRNSLGGGISIIVTEDDPVVHSVNASAGSLVLFDNQAPFTKPVLYLKTDDGDTTSVQQMVKRHEYTATAAPIPANDWSMGYSAGSDWYDTVAQLLYRCVDGAVGAAVWIRCN